MELYRSYGYKINDLDVVVSPNALEDFIKRYVQEVVDDQNAVFVSFDSRTNQIDWSHEPADCLTCRDEDTDNLDDVCMEHVESDWVELTSVDVWGVA